MIRAVNPTAEILILGYVPPQRAAEVSRLRLSLTLTSYDQACQLDQTGFAIDAHLPVDTGMHRLGEAAEDLDAIVTIRCPIFGLPAFIRISMKRIIWTRKPSHIRRLRSTGFSMSQTL